MQNIRNSFFGYNKKDIHDLIFQKDQIIDTQQKDIDYLRSENQSLQSKLNNKHFVNRATKIEQEQLDSQQELPKLD